MHRGLLKTVHKYCRNATMVAVVFCLYLSSPEVGLFYHHRRRRLLAAEIRRRCKVVCRFILWCGDSLLQQVGDAYDTPTTTAPGRRANDNINFINSFLQLGVQ